jgi:fructose-1,6-bisphosphatase I
LHEHARKAAIAEAQPVHESEGERMMNDVASPRADQVEPSTQATTLHRHAGMRAAARGAPRLAGLVTEIAFAAKVVARETRQAALTGRLGIVGSANASGDTQKELDVLANRIFLDSLDASGLVAAVVSEELEGVELQHCDGEAEYLVCLDPVDGSSNLKVGTSLGSIFGIYRRTRRGNCTDIEQELLNEATLIASGYVLYGAATAFVYTLGEGVDGFVLDQGIGEFLLSHPNIRCPHSGDRYSINTGNSHLWEPGVANFVGHLNEVSPETGRPCTLRYSGALMADLHRILLEGGIYCYPADREHPEGKLRLLYEAAPLGLLVEAAGGRASSGRERIIEVPRRSLHQTTPLALGSAADVATYERFLAGAAG